MCVCARNQQFIIIIIGKVCGRGALAAGVAAQMADWDEREQAASVCVCVSERERTNEPIQLTNQYVVCLRERSNDCNKTTAQRGPNQRKQYDALSSICKRSACEPESSRWVPKQNKKKQ